MVPLVHQGVPASEWDAALERQGGHFLQSSAWLRVQGALGFDTLWEQSESWCWAGSLGSRTGLGYLYVPCGPTAVGAELAPAIAAIADAGRERRLDFVRMEPGVGVSVGELLARGARPAPSVQPQYTWMLDLDGEEDALLAQLTTGQRRNVRAAERKGISFRRSRDPADAATFIELVRGTGAHTGFRPQSDAYYRTLLEVLMPLGAGSLHLAEAEGRAVAAVIEFEFGTTSYYGHAAADSEMNRRLRASAPLVWSLVRQAKADGKRHFDFWGVLPDDDADHPWAGFSQFKKSFGGRLVGRPGTWELPLRPAKYALYTALRRVTAARG